MTDNAFGSSFGAAAPATPAAQQPASGGGFGSFLGSLGFGAQYTPPDPNASPVDQAADLLKQRTKRAGEIATNPILQVFAPEDVQAARDFVPKASEQLQQIQAQRQHAADIKQTARNWGLVNPSQFGDSATDTTLANEALRQWKDEGNFNAYKALSGLSPEWANRANLYMPDAMAKFGDHVSAVQDGIRVLNNAASSPGGQAAFDAARNKVMKDHDLSALGIKESQIPKTPVEWIAKRGSLMATYAQAARTLADFNAKQDQLNQALPVTDEKVAKQVEGSYQHANGEAIPGFKAVTLPGYGDVSGVQGPPGSRDTANFGRTTAERDQGPTLPSWSTASPEQVKTVNDQLGETQVKGALNKYKMAREFAELVNDPRSFKSAANVSVITGELGALERDVAEASTAAGTPGLSKILETKYGTVDSARNAIARESAALKEWMGKPPNSQTRLSVPSIEGIKEVAAFKHEQTLKEVRERTQQPLETAGRYGIKPENLGLERELLAQPEIMSTYDNAVLQARKTIDSYPMVPIGDRRVMLPQGSNVPGAKVMTLDHGPAASVPSGLPGSFYGPTGSATAGGAPTVEKGAITPGPAGIPSNYADAIKRTEGFEGRAKWDYKQFTNGYGTRATHSAEVIDRPTAERRFNDEITKAATVVDKINPNLDPGTRAALTSLTFNAGDAWTKSGLGEKVRAGDIAGAKAAFLQYNKAGGETNDGLASRRIREARWFGQDGSAAPDQSPAVASQPSWVTSIAEPTLTDPRMTSQEAGLPPTQPFLPAVQAFGSELQSPTAAPPTLQPTVPAAYGGMRTGVRSPASLAAQRVAANAPPAPRPPLRGRAARMAALGEKVAGMSPADIAHSVADSAVEYAPAIGSTAGFGAGMFAGGPPAAFVGGGLGAAAGQAAKDYMQGREQSPADIATQGVLGSALSIFPEGRPVVGALARTLGVGAVAGGKTAIQGGDTVDTGFAAAEGAGAAALGEGFGQALGMIGHKIWKMFAPDAKKAIIEAAGKYADATDVLRTEQSTLKNAAGSSMGPNPAYAAAEKDKLEAEAVLKDAGLKPEEAAYAHRATMAGVPKQEAVARRPGDIEQRDLGRQYDQLEQELPPRKGLKDAMDQVRAMKVLGGRLNDGPIAAVVKGDVVQSKANTELAQHIEANITGPAKNWAEKWVQLKDARTSLLEAERDAETSTATGRSQVAKDMRTLADTVRTQQEKSASVALGPKAGAAFIDRLKVIDARYRNWAEATNGGDVAKAVAMKGDAGREAEKRFMAFAAHDPEAQRAYRAMRGVKGDPFEATIPWTVAAEGIPVLGKAVKLTKMAGMINSWMARQEAGDPVRFRDLVKLPHNDRGRMIGDAAGVYGNIIAIKGFGVIPGSGQDEENGGGSPGVRWPIAPARTAP